MNADRTMLKVWLRDAHAMERSTIANQERLVRRLVSYPELYRKFSEHLGQSREQLRLVERCLRHLGAEPSRLKDAVARIGGMAEIWPVALSRDELAKHCLAAYAFKQFEMASYRMIAAAADANEESEIREICERILGEEQAMADWLFERLPGIARDYKDRIDGGSGFVRDTIKTVGQYPALTAAAATGIVLLFMRACKGGKQPRSSKFR